MSVNYSISDARRSLPQIIRDAEVGNKAKITRHGQVVAVLIGAGEFERLESERPSFVQAYRAFLERVDPEALIPTADELLHGLRDSRPGREFSFDE